MNFLPNEFVYMIYATFSKSLTSESIFVNFSIHVDYLPKIVDFDFEFGLVLFGKSCSYIDTFIAKTPNRLVLNELHISM